MGTRRGGKSFLWAGFRAQNHAGTRYAFHESNLHALMLRLFFLLLLLPLRTDAQHDPLLSLRQLPPFEADEVLWLARCLLSEADRAEEQRLVAWVVRNRVETRYRGSTYREVILEPYQFSAFNTPSPRRDEILRLTPYSTSAWGWQTAVEIALEVYQAPETARPFPVTVRHFYSPISMPEHRAPQWAQGRTPLSLPGIDSFRFQFFDDIDEGVIAGTLGHATATQQRISVSDSSERAARFESIRSRQRSAIARPERPASARRAVRPEPQ